MKTISSTLSLLCFAALMFSGCNGKDPLDGKCLKDYYADQFLIGVAVNYDQAAGKDSLATDAIKKHFNTISPENCMKSEYIAPAEGEYFWDDADQYVQYGENLGVAVMGGSLIWHSQCAPWFFVDKDGNQIDAETLKQRMHDHIFAIMTRYRGRIKGYDVVNEALADNGKFRNSPFYEIMGEEYIYWAFECAHEADPEAELYYNDYSLAIPAKREAMLTLIKNIQARGLRIDAVGLQSHMGMMHPDFSQFEKTIQGIISLGIPVQFTEFDMDAIPTVSFGAAVEDNHEYNKALDPYPNGLPDSASVVWNERMARVFDIFEKYADNVKRVTAWGVQDGNSWKNDWPMKGRTNYPLLLDRDYELKPFLKEKLRNFDPVKAQEMREKKRLEKEMTDATNAEVTAAAGE